jgi:predicted dehydrogenase
MSRLRLGVIGAGSWVVASHLPTLAARRDELEFVGVCRHGPELLEHVRDRFGFQVASEDYRDVLAAGIDLCIVASPTALHHEHANAALLAGAHVLVEKPITIAPADAWDLVAVATAEGRHLVCSFGWNYRSLFVRARELMNAFGVGPIEHLAIRMASFTRDLLSNRGAYPKAAPDAIPEQRTWTDPILSGGGYAQAQLSHALAAALWLTGQRGAEVAAFMSAPLDAPVELHDAIILRMRDGAIGVLAGGSAHADAVGAPENELDINVIGRDGQFELSVARGSARLLRPDGERTVDLGPAGGAYDCVGPPLALVDLALGRSVANQTPGELGARTVEILAAAYASARTGQRVAIDDIAIPGSVSPPRGELGQTHPSDSRVDR